MGFFFREINAAKFRSKYLYSFYIICFRVISRENIALKGVFSKPSGWQIDAPILCFFFKFWLLAYVLISFNCAKFQQDWTTLILDIS